MHLTILKYIFFRIDYTPGIVLGTVNSAMMKQSP